MGSEEFYGRKDSLGSFGRGSGVVLRNVLPERGEVPDRPARAPLLPQPRSPSLRSCFAIHFWSRCERGARPFS